MFGLENLFDLNRDGKLDAIEQGAMLGFLCELDSDFQKKTPDPNGCRKNKSIFDDDQDNANDF